MNLQKLFLSFFGSGYSPVAPGTIGTLASIPVGILIIIFFGTPTLNTLAIAVAIVAVIEINKFEKSGGEHDAKWIVIDETIGIWITQSIAFEGMMQLHLANLKTSIIVSTIISFIFFRLFDIWKPSTIGTIDKKVKGGLGVVLDDVLAAVAGAMLALIVFNLIAYYKIDLNSLFSFLNF